MKNWSVEYKIFINGHLTKDKRIIFAKIRAVAKEKKYKFLQIINTEILTWKDENFKSRIRNSNDLKKKKMQIYVGILSW